MNRRFALTAIPLLFALPASAAAPKAKPRPRPAAVVPPPPPLGDIVRVALVTELGTIELELDDKRAPITVENFVLRRPQAL